VDAEEQHLYFSKEILLTKMSSNEADRRVVEKLNNYHGDFDYEYDHPPEIRDVWPETEIKRAFIVEYLMSRLTLPLKSGFKLKMAARQGDSVDESGQLDVACEKHDDMEAGGRGLTSVVASSSDRRRCVGCFKP
jgi:hypothetical protein